MLPPPDQALLALLFAAGQRPTAAQVEAAGSGTGAFSVSYAPDPPAGWIEVLVTGLTFEVHGLAPGAGEPVPPIAHRYGLPGVGAEANLEASSIRLGPHLAGGGAMPPVVRGAIALAQALAGAERAAAVVWLPARSAMASDYFATAATAWLGGGAFPVPGLVALVETRDGLSSQGLAFFTGQEVEASWLGAAKPDLARCLIRAVHLLVEHGPVAAATRLRTPEGDMLRIEPRSSGQLQVRIER